MSPFRVKVRFNRHAHSHQRLHKGDRVFEKNDRVRLGGPDERGRRRRCHLLLGAQQVNERQVRRLPHQDLSNAGMQRVRKTYDRVGQT